MVIKASASAEIRQLVQALGGDDDVARESAIARLAIIGSRAVDRLAAVYDENPSRRTRLAVLRALEPIGDDRTIGLARSAIADGGDLAVAATGLLRGLLDSPHAQTSAAALDALVTAALDRGAAHSLRLAAFEALQGLAPAVRAPVAAALRDDPDPALQAAMHDAPHDPTAAGAAWQDAIEGRLPDLPAVLRDAVVARGAAAPVTELHTLIERIRERERALAPSMERAEWSAVRGALHQALALRESRLAVYDLRESLADARAPLPASFLSALHAVGDQSCLEPVAAARARATDPRWSQQLHEAFRAIMKRERLTARSAVVRKILARWPGVMS